MKLLVINRDQMHGKLFVVKFAFLAHHVVSHFLVRVMFYLLDIMSCHGQGYDYDQLYVWI